MEWDLGDGDIPTVTEEVGRGIHGGMVDLCSHGAHLPKKKRFDFSKKRPIFFEKT